MEDLLYSEELLHSIQLTDWPHATFNPPVTIDKPGEELVIRPLRRTDFPKGEFRYIFSKSYCYLSYLLIGFPQILSQMTAVGNVTEEQFLGKAEHCKASSQCFLS